MSRRGDAGFVRARAGWRRTQLVRLVEVDEDSQLVVQKLELEQRALARGDRHVSPEARGELAQHLHGGRHGVGEVLGPNKHRNEHARRDQREDRHHS